jgi:hypothetical protein
MTKEFETVEIRVEEGVDLAPELNNLYFPMGCYMGEIFQRSMLCK